LAEFHRIVPLVLNEHGCIEYGPAIDLDSGITAQASLRSNVVTIIEKWATLADLQAHLVAPHMVDYRPRVKEMILRSTLHVLEAA
jgi:quinol monooxygenase YgiN